MCNDPRFVFYVPNYSIIRHFLIPTKVVDYKVHVAKDGSEYVFEFLPFEVWRRLRTFLSYSGFERFCIEVPCRKCLGCLADRRKDWVRRIMYEAENHKHNGFYTFTYDEEHLESFSLRRRHFQLFMKRLRKYCAKKGYSSPRVYYRGEYGDRKERPHFHAILFNYVPERPEFLFAMTKNNKKVWHWVQGSTPYFVDEKLRELWSYGNILYTPLTQQNARYVAKYTSKIALERRRIDVVTGEVRCEPFNGYSCRPAIGRSYYEKKWYTEPEKLMDVAYFRRLLKQMLFEEDYAALHADFLSCVQGAIQPWEKTDLTKYEYLKQREERMRSTFQRFGQKFEKALAFG